jgi:hypothetical protein
MKRDILIAIIGGSIFIIGTTLFLLSNGKDEIKDEVVYTNCDSFSNQQEAQEYFLENNAVHLDRDKDGIACEDLEPKVSPALIQRITPQAIRTPEESPEVDVPPIRVESTVEVVQATPEPTSEPIKPTTEPKEPVESTQPSPTPSPAEQEPILDPVCNLLPILC